MRKLSVAPLLLLLVIFLWTHFASASAAPAALPAKKKKRTTVTVETGLAKTLPTKTKVIMNFEQPAESDGPAVVIRETAPASSSKEFNKVQAVPHHEISEAPVYDFIGPEPQRALHQALPDSDSFVDVPAAAKRPLVQMPTSGFAPAKPLPLYVPRAVEIPTTTTVTVSGSTSAPEFVGPPAPPVFDTTSARTDVTVATATTTALAPAAAPAVTSLQTTVIVAHEEAPRRRFFVRGGYLDAAYSKIESDLKNGATLFGLSASQQFSQTEVRLGLDLAHGLDQSVTLRNTRMVLLRAEGLYNLVNAKDAASFYVGGALGLADIDVTSFRSQNANGDVTVRENAKGTALLAAPEIGARLFIGRDISIDLAAQYLLLAGGGQASNLGGLLGEAALGFSF